MARRRFKPWKPYVPPKPPAGSYDPALDAARAAASRGYGDVRQDTETADTRAGVDYGLQTEGINRNFGRYQEDYRRNTGLLQQAFQRLGTQQTSQAAGAGVLSGGALLQSAAKRAANQAQQQGQLDLGLRRTTEDRDLALGQAGLGYGRGVEDRALGLRRAGREDRAFGLDTGAQIAFNASQGGYVPPQPGEPGGAPRGLFTNKAGRQRRKIVKNGVEYIVAPDGSVVHKRRVG